MERESTWEWSRNNRNGIKETRMRGKERREREDERKGERENKREEGREKR